MTVSREGYRPQTKRVVVTNQPEHSEARRLDFTLMPMVSYGTAFKINIDLDFFKSSDRERSERAKSGNWTIHLMQIGPQ